MYSCELEFTSSTSKDCVHLAACLKSWPEPHDWHPFTWLVGVETGTGTLENCVTVSTNAVHTPTLGPCPFTLKCAPNKHTPATKDKQEKLHGIICNSPSGKWQIVHQQQNSWILWSIQIMECSSAMKKDTLGQSTTWVSFREIILKDMKSACCMVPCIWGSRVKMIYGSGSNQGWFGPQGTFGNVWIYFQLSQLNGECYRNPVGQSHWTGQGTGQPSSHRITGPRGPQCQRWETDV